MGIFDYGAGNIENVARAFTSIGESPQLITKPSQAKGITHAVIPGVGAFDYGMDMLRASGLDESIKTLASGEFPVLGICLGMQLLADYGEENGLHSGLGLIPGSVKPLLVSNSALANTTVPHVGWERVKNEFTKISEHNSEEDFYFCHSYHFVPEHDSNIFSKFEWGSKELAGGIFKDNVFGVQFHPEKSARAGLRFLEKFMSL